MTPGRSVTLVPVWSDLPLRRALMSVSASASHPRAPSRILARAALCWMMLAGTPAPDPAHAQASACSYGAWSAPVPLGRRVLRVPSVATIGATTYAVGNNISRLLDSVATDTLFTAIDLAGHSLGRPSGLHLVAQPFAVPLRDSSLLMLWGDYEILAAGERISWPGQLTQVWSARWHPRDGWSVSEPIVRDTVRIWFGNQRTTPVRTSDGDVHFAMPVRTAGVQYLRYHAGSWRTVTIPKTRPAAYASLGTDSAGATIVIAYIGVDPTVIPDYNSVFVV